MKHRLISLSLVVLLAGCQTLEKVDKGLYDVADGVAKPDVVTGERNVNFASRDAQIQSGDSAIQEEIKQYGSNINQNVDAKAYKRLQAVFNRLHSVTHYRNENWTVVLIPDPSFNAFVMGGTCVVVNKGLMNEIQNDDELAAILGHEMGHVTANHASEAQAIMATRVRSKNSAKAERFETAFTVDQEREADKIGILYAALAGYDPNAASQLWSRLYKKSGNDAGFLNSHPINSERGEATRVIASNVQQYYKRNQINPQFAAILENNTLWQKNTVESDVAAGKGGGLLAVASAAVNTMATIQNAKLEQAQQNERINLIQTVATLIQLKGYDITGPASYGFHYQYIGNMPIHNLALKTQYGSEILIYHSEDIIQPGQEFIAEFITNEPVRKNKIHVGSIVDNAEFAN